VFNKQAEGAEAQPTDAKRRSIHYDG